MAQAARHAHADWPFAVESYLLHDDGIIPNSRLPLLIYRQALERKYLAGEPEDAFKRLFGGHAWTGSWVDGIYDYHHYHSTAHEVLGLARGSATVQFGGPTGIITELRPGDVIIIPGGVGHCRLSAGDISVIGAYADGHDWDICRARAEDRPEALTNLAALSHPTQDPVLGERGPLTETWDDEALP